MTKNRFYIVVMSCLLVSNLLLIAFITLGKQHKPHERPREIIIRKLNFDNQQIEKYDRLIKTHQRQLREKDEEIFVVKNQLYQLLNTDADSLKKDSLIARIAAIQKDIEMIHFDHFRDIKNTCRPEQTEAFDKLAGEIADIFSHKPPGPR